MQSTQNYYRAKYYKYFIYSFMDHLYTKQNHLQCNECVFQYLFNATLKFSFSILRLMRLRDKLLKNLMPA
jgi:hypothetical protein